MNIKTIDSDTLLNVLNACKILQDIIKEDDSTVMIKKGLKLEEGLCVNGENIARKKFGITTYNIVAHIVAGCSKSWEHFSGDICFPVKSHLPGYIPSKAYMLTQNKFCPEYINQRRSLLAHVIKCIEKELNHRKEVTYHA